MLAIYSNFNDDNVKYHIKGYKKSNIQSQQINDLNFTKKILINQKPIPNFYQYINCYINTNGKN